MIPNDQPHVLSPEYRDLTPALLWKLFAELAAIPRPSMEERRAVEWVLTLARKQRGWETVTDKEGNVLVRVPATEGHANAPTVILQAHLDMVTIKRSDSPHDFQRDPIRLRVTEHRGERIVAAEGTTLGADNGIGVVAALAAALDPQTTHGPLELLFTTNEESGMTGARGMKLPGIRGRLLINLDSEEDDAVYTGCVGRTEVFTVWQKPAPPATQDCAEGSARTQTVQVKVHGLPGGHSGLEIHQPRGNALLTLAQTIGELEEGSWRLANVSGGARHNAIPDSAEAVVLCTPQAAQRLESLCEATTDALRKELGEYGESAEVVLENKERSAPAALTPEDSVAVLRAVANLPHGVLARSQDDPTVIETSNNVALAKTESSNGGLRIEVESSLRSVSEKEMRLWRERIAEQARTARGDSRARQMYPPWKPNPESQLVEVAASVYARLHGEPPRRAVIHGGLECALIGALIPGVDMVSIGPRIEEPHTPRERVYTASVERFWQWLQALLAETATLGK